MSMWRWFYKLNMFAGYLDIHVDALCDELDR